MCVCVLVSSCQATEVLKSKYLAARRVMVSVGGVIKYHQRKESDNQGVDSAEKRALQEGHSVIVPYFLLSISLHVDCSLNRTC